MNGDIIILFIILFIFIIGLIIIIVLRPTNYGEWQTLYTTSCGSDSCNQTGTQTTVQQCLPTVNGRGCLDDGKEKFGKRC